MTSLRSAVLLYIHFTIMGLPLDLTMCAQCTDKNGAMSTFCFNGLQLGYGLKHKKPFHRESVRCSALPLASVHAHLIKDAALRNAIGFIFTVSDSAPSTNSKTVSTLASMRGYVMAVTVSAPAPGVPGWSPRKRWRSLPKGRCALPQSRPKRLVSRAVLGCAPRVRRYHPTGRSL